MLQIIYRLILFNQDDIAMFLSYALCCRDTIQVADIIWIGLSFIRGSLHLIKHIVKSTGLSLQSSRVRYTVVLEALMIYFIYKSMIIYFNGIRLLKYNTIIYIFDNNNSKYKSCLMDSCDDIVRFLRSRIEWQTKLINFIRQQHIYISTFYSLVPSKNMINMLENREGDTNNKELQDMFEIGTITNLIKDQIIQWCGHIIRLIEN
ncbi:hypothetical protein AGLY_002881 [Aphis glycines]|uniref:Uncharacterized protein n=1 Tax=Aphis glycines TaxID=307491 RepID=A0A6G0U2G4_APHGL|nr:hypothetical protein AGLY_002881 [Aphis glycines]